MSNPKIPAGTLVISKTSIEPSFGIVDGDVPHGATHMRLTDMAGPTEVRGWIVVTPESLRQRAREMDAQALWCAHEIALYKVNQRTARESEKAAVRLREMADRLERGEEIFTGPSSCGIDG